MIKKLFGETPEEQYRYLKPRLIAAGLSLVLPLLGGLFHLVGLDGIGGTLAAIGTPLFAIVMLIFGKALLKGLFGIASFGVLFSNNVVLGVIVLILYLTVGYFGGLVVAVIGLCRFLTLLKQQKGR